MARSGPLASLPESPGRGLWLAPELSGTRKANEGNQDGTLQERLGQLLDQLQPEAAYFYPENGKRTLFIVFNMQDPSQIPPTLEPLF